MSHPQRFIFNDNDFSMFLKSSAKEELLRFTMGLGKSCSSSETSYVFDHTNPLQGLSPSLASLHGSLRSMLTWVDDFPPVDQSMARFGNPAFKKWHRRLTQRSVSIVYNIVKLCHRDSVVETVQNESIYDDTTLATASEEGYRAAKETKSIDSIENNEDRELVQELTSYLHPAFGHEIRLDYGTGHECSFQVFFMCMCKIGCFGGSKERPPSMTRLKAATLSIWTAFLAVTRQLQVDYMLEPAGSHGVWGLDDYYCLPFYFGSCQMESDADEYTPKSIHDDGALTKDGNNLMYLGCIRFIKSIKKGVPFFESSPMLNDISNLPNWSKVSSGLLKLFEGEVLNKRQVVQHLVFGNTFAADWTPSHDPREAPTGTFRVGTISTPALVASQSHDLTTGTSTSRTSTSTRAPWAK